MACSDGPSNGCMASRINSWTDLQQTCPKDPRDLIAYAMIESQVGSFELSSNYIAPGTWVTSPLEVSDDPTVSALGTDDLQKVADANQWNFQHQTWNSSSALAIPLRKLVFLRAGTMWLNRLPLDLGETPIQEIQISFLSNAGTRGDAQGKVPVIRWSGVSLANQVFLEVTLKVAGQVQIGIWTYNGTNYQMYEMIWAVTG